MHATTVAVDLAKTVFELAFANAQWHIVGRQRLNRRNLRGYSRSSRRSTW
jgi:transposase